MITGLNTNILIRGATYHVETEAGSAGNLSMTTVLFRGGHVLANVKGSLADLAGAIDFDVQARIRMRAQHRTLIRDLLVGKYGALEETGQPELSLDETSETVAGQSAVSGEDGRITITVRESGLPPRPGGSSSSSSNPSPA